MKILLVLEEAAQLLVALAGLYYQPIRISWWLWPFLFLSPDISMIGYSLNPVAGAWLYNFVHHKAVAICLIGAGWFLQVPVVLFAGLLLYAHSCFDRVLGYGLKYENSFRHTHLGMIGKPAGRRNTNS